MTVCIAAQFQLTPPHVEKAQSAFVLCTDGRVSGGAWGSDNKAIKTQLLGYNFVALLAGDWSPVRELGAQLERDMKEGPLPLDKAEVFTRVERGAVRFSSSRLCPKKVVCEAIVTGFIGQEPMILLVNITDRKPSVTVSQDKEEIGEGAFAARMMLHHRGYDPHNIDLARACYLVYEAKKFSENVDSVGHLTWLKVHSIGEPDGHEGEPGAHCLMDINERGLAILEGWREELFLQSTDDLKGVQFSYFR